MDNDLTFERYPLLPLRDVIVFPHMAVPLFVGRPRSISALEEAVAKDKMIFLAAQKESRVDDPDADDVYPFGTLGEIMQMIKLPDGTFKVLLEGKSRGRIVEFLRQGCLLPTSAPYRKWQRRPRNRGADADGGRDFRKALRSAEEPPSGRAVQSTTDPFPFCDTVIFPSHRQGGRETGKSCKA